MVKFRSDFLFVLNDDWNIVWQKDLAILQREVVFVSMKEVLTQSSNLSMVKFRSDFLFVGNDDWNIDLQKNLEILQREVVFV